MATSTFTSQLAERYAQALFDLASEAKGLDETRSDLLSLRKAIEENKDLRSLIRSPLYKREDQARALKAILEKAGATPLVQKFVGLVAEQRRLFALPDMAKAFAAMVARHKGEMTAQVQSAHPLSEEQMSKLKQIMRDTFGKDVALETIEKPALLGGLVLQVGSRMIDGSLATRLNNLEQAMKEA